jgi:hypothetical protein
MQTKSQCVTKSLQVNLFGVLAPVRRTRLVPSPASTLFFEGRPVVRYKVANSGSK